MKCKICHKNYIDTTDGKCYECMIKPEYYSWPSFERYIPIQNSDQTEITKEDEELFYRVAFKTTGD